MFCSVLRPNHSVVQGTDDINTKFTISIHFHVLLFHKNITKLVFLWPNMSQKSFKVLKISLLNAPILRNKINEPFCLENAPNLTHFDCLKCHTKTQVNFNAFSRQNGSFIFS